ncbi:MAG: phosphotransferase [Ilumatobacteraceae bacterium]
MSDITIPANPAAVTAEWMTEVLHRSGALPAASSVAAVVLEPLGAGVGVMGELARVRLTYAGPQGEAPNSVIVKSPSPFEENRAQGVGLGMYEAEIRFMKELDAHTAVRTPRVFMADIVLGTAEFVVVMEDLGHLVMGDQVEGVTVDQARDAIVVMADLHAGWWGKVQTPAMEWVPSVVHARIEGLAGMWPALWMGFNAKFEYCLPEGGKEAGELISQHYWAVMNKIAELPWTLLHQDYRVDNLFFDSENRDEPVVVIDWQGIGRGPGLYDLCYFLGGSLTIEDRRANERALVEAYGARLAERGIDYPIEQLWHDYRFGHLTSCSTAVLVGATFDVANERGKALVETLGSRHFQAVIDLHSTELLSELDA